MFNTFLNDWTHCLNNIKNKNKKIGYSQTNPREESLPKSNPYFFIYSPQSDIFHNAATNHEIFPLYFAKKWLVVETRGR